MPSFNYVCRDSQGGAHKGQVDAQSKDAAAKWLIEQNMTPISIESQQNWRWQNWFNRGPKTEELILLSDQLSRLLGSGVSIINALQIIIQNSESSKLKRALEKVVHDIGSGLTLSTALRQHPLIFSGLFISIVEIGEQTGKIHYAFAQIRDYLKQDLFTRRRVKVALRYPIIVVSAVFLAVIVINVFVVPAFMEFFKSFDAVLPLPTRMLIASSNFFTQNSYLLIILGVLGIIIARKAFQYPVFAIKVARMMLKLPWLGKFIQNATNARFSRCFAFVLESDVPLLVSLDIAQGVVDNLVYAEKMKILKQAIQHGESFLQAARASELFEPMVLQMISVAERTGELEKVFFELANYYDSECEYAIDNIGGIVEPILIIIVSMMVLILALGVFLPMWDMTTVAFH